MLSKAELLAAILAELKESRDKAAQAADAARETATSKENAAENKYDTLGLEAAYLAHGQSDRILQLEEDIRAYEQIDVKETSRVQLGSLVELEDEDGMTSVIFIGPGSGGLKVTHDDRTIQVIMCHL